MPIIKSAIKRVKQEKKKTVRNNETKSVMRTYIKKVFLSIKDNNVEEAQKHMQTAYKLIDTAAKKNVIHKNNAARKKSQLAKAVNALATSDKAGKTKSAPKTKEKKADPKDSK